MSRKIQIIRILVVVLTIVTFVGYFAFSTLLFPPFESGLGVDVSGLVPRRVDFFFARADLRDSFEKFPRLKLADSIEGNEAWQAWVGSPEYETFAATYGFGELRAEMRAQLDQLPPGFEPMELFGGSDLAVAGEFKGNAIGDSDWAVYGTLSGMGKLGIALLAFPSTIGLEGQGIAVEPDEGFVTLSGGQLPSPLSIARIRDVGVISNSKDLVRAAIELEERQFKDSFLAGATYHDKIQLANRDGAGDEVEIYLNSRAMLETLKVSGVWPDPSSQDFFPSFFSRYFQLGLINRVVGILGLDGGLSTDLSISLSSELMTPLQTRASRLRAVSGDDLVNRYAVFAPEDTALFVYFKCDIGDLLTSVVGSMEPATRNLIEERFQATGKYRNLLQLIDELDGALLDHLVVIVRENDFAQEENGPPHNDEPVPAVAIVTWLTGEGRTKIDELRHTIGSMGPSIGLQGAEPGQAGFYSNNVGGHEFNEYWSQHIDGTGVITAGTTSEVFIVANTVQMFNHVHKTWTQGAPTHPRLSERTDFRVLANSASQGANLAVWFNPNALSGTLNRMVDRWAMDGIDIDWAFERARVEDKILREQYPGKQKATLSPLETADFERAVDQRVDEIDMEIRRTQVPMAREAYARKLKYIGSIRAGLMMISLNDKPASADLSLRLLTPLGD